MYLHNNRKIVVSVVLFLSVLLLVACGGALQDVKSSDVQICQKGVDAILLEGNEDGIRGMEDAVKSGEANAQLVVDRLLAIENDKSLSDKYNGKAHELLSDVFYGKMGDAALQIFESDPRSAVMFDSIFEDLGSSSFDKDKNYIIKHLANITTPEITSKMLDNYMAPANTGISDNIADILKQNKLNDTFLSYWPAYYETNGLEKIDSGRIAINNAFLNVPLNEYEKPLSYVSQVTDNRSAYDISNYTEYGGSDIWGNADISSLDKDKTVIFDVQDDIDGNKNLSWSPYSFILVPKEKCLSAEGLYNAGTVICIHRTVHDCGTYTPMGIDPSMVQGGGVKAYSQSVIITKADRINKSVTVVRVLDGATVGDEINVYVNGGDTYMASPPAEEDVIKTLQQEFEEAEAYYDFTDVVDDVELDSVNVRYDSISVVYDEKEPGRYITLELTCYRPLESCKDEEQYLNQFRSLPGAVDFTVNGHKAVKQENSIMYSNLYFWVEDGTGIVLSVPFWLLELYPEETFFDIRKVDIKPGGIK